jgi:hypothetical protein
MQPFNLPPYFSEALTAIEHDIQGPTLHSPLSSEQEDVKGKLSFRGFGFREDPLLVIDRDIFTLV